MWRMSKWEKIFPGPREVFRGHSKYSESIASPREQAIKEKSKEIAKSFESCRGRGNFILQKNNMEIASTSTYHCEVFSIEL
jgi:hypothetical protein